MFGMSTAGEFVANHYLIVFFALCGLTALVVSFVRQSIRQEKESKWPLTEGTIQSVGRVHVNAGRDSYDVDVGDFSYTVEDEYFSGRLTISPSDSAGDLSPRVLINQKIQVHYDPRKPEDFSVPVAEISGFRLDSYNEPFGTDIDPIVLNIDKT
jgi:hypothetical protein